VHLGDRRRRDRRLVERRECPIEGTAQVFLDDAPHDRERLRRDLVAAALELVDQLGREQPLPGRHDLPELDVRRTESLERRAQTA
jgi:hypothetical protein